jgi:hypothetical protein
MFVLVSLLACSPQPTPTPVPPPPPAGEWMQLAPPPGSPGGTLCWAWKGVDPLCRWGEAGPVPPPPIPEPPKAESEKVEDAPPAVEGKP